MKHKATFSLYGEFVELKFRSFRQGDSERQAADVKVSVNMPQKGAQTFVATLFDTKDIARLNSLREGDEVCVSGRMSGGENKYGYMNYYLTAEAILLPPGDIPESLNSTQPPQPSGFKPPKNFTEAAAYAQKFSNVDLPF